MLTVVLMEEVDITVCLLCFDLQRYICALKYFLFYISGCQFHPKEGLDYWTKGCNSELLFLFLISPFLFLGEEKGRGRGMGMG